MTTPLPTPKESRSLRQRHRQRLPLPRSSNDVPDAASTMNAGLVPPVAARLVFASVSGTSLSAFAPHSDAPENSSRTRRQQLVARAGVPVDGGSCRSLPMHSTDGPRVSAALLPGTREPTLTVPDERRPLRSRAALAAGFARTAGRGPRTAEDPTSGKSPERPVSSPAASQMTDARDRRRHERRSCWRSASFDCFSPPSRCRGGVHALSHRCFWNTSR